MNQGTTLIDISRMPRTIHGSSGFPKALYDHPYPAPIASELAQNVVSLLASHHAEGGDRWGAIAMRYFVFHAPHPHHDATTLDAHE